ncbi:MAG: ferric reductase-like transmembrane domain-containing protein [Syntrophobacterales bacterium]|nr:ferric reductase-like transmembrane domain-containing protein [Syntrophobacterales bacterium]
MVGNRLLRWLWVLVWICLFGFFCFLWGSVVKDRFIAESWIDKIADLGNLCGIIALYLMVLMTAVGIRFPILEKPFGLDRLIRFHKKFGIVVILFVMAHVASKVFKYSQVVGGRTEDVWDFIAQFSPYTWNLTDNALVIARWALLILIIAVFFAKAGQYVVPFKLWKPFHGLVYLVTPAAILHSFLIGSDIRIFPMIIGWGGLGVLWLILAGYRFSYIAGRSHECRWFLESVRQETHDTHTYTFVRHEGPGRFCSWYPGQFAIFRYNTGFIGWSEPHPFTLSCAPGEGKISCTVKAVGSFTRRLQTIAPGTPFLCEGPYGIFTPRFKEGAHLIFIAGGVGITPFLSMIRHVAKNNVPVRVTLIWGNKTKEDIIAYEELSHLAKTSSWLKVVHILSAQRITEEFWKDVENDGFFWEEGFVRGGILEKYITDLNNTQFFLCGPPPMQRFVLEELKNTLRISPRKVKREFFFF